MANDNKETDTTKKDEKNSDKEENSGDDKSESKIMDEGKQMAKIMMIKMIIRSLL